MLERKLEHVPISEESQKQESAKQNPAHPPSVFIASHPPSPAFTFRSLQCVIQAYREADAQVKDRRLMFVQGRTAQVRHELKVER